MTARELRDAILYNGQESCMRKICIKRKIIPAEKLALMHINEVCEVMAKHFEILGVRNGGETILLVEKDKWDEVMKSVVPLYR